MTTAIENLYHRTNIDPALGGVALGGVAKLDIGMDINGWIGQTAEELNTLADALPEASGFVIHPGSTDILAVTKEIADSERAVILDDTNLMPDASAGDVWADPEQLLEHGVQFAIKPFTPNPRAVLNPRAMNRSGINTIVTLAPYEWQNLSATGGASAEKVARLMIASAATMNPDDIPRILLPAGRDLWTSRLRQELIAQNNGISYFANTPGRTAEQALKANRRQAVRAIVSPPGGAEFAEDPVKATLHEAKRVDRALHRIELPVAESAQPSNRPERHATKHYPAPLTTDELRSVAKLFTEFSQRI